MSYLYQQLTPAEQRAVDQAHHQAQQALFAEIIAGIKPPSPRPSGTPEGRAAVENFIKGMNEKRAAKPNPLLPTEQTTE